MLSHTTKPARYARMVPEEDEKDDDSEEEGLSPTEPRFSAAEIAAAEAQIVEQSKRIDFYITESYLSP